MFTLFIVPMSPFGRMGEPIYLAAVSLSALTIALMVMRLRARRNARLEKLLLALFLGAMPMIYTVTALRNGESGSVLALEGAAIVVFGGLAVIGGCDPEKRSPTRKLALVMPTHLEVTMRDPNDVDHLRVSATCSPQTRPLFGTAPVIGFVDSPWFLVAGIAAHGLIWDGSHHAEHLVVPIWYAVFCFVVDVMLAAYVATQIRTYSSLQITGTGV